MHRTIAKHKTTGCTQTYGIPNRIHNAGFHAASGKNNKKQTMFTPMSHNVFGRSTIIQGKPMLQCTSSRRQSIESLWDMHSACHCAGAALSFQSVFCSISTRRSRHFTPAADRPSNVLPLFFFLFCVFRLCCVFCVIVVSAFSLSESLFVAL